MPNLTVRAKNQTMSISLAPRHSRPISRLLEKQASKNNSLSSASMQYYYCCATCARGELELKKEMTLLGLVAATYFMVSGGPYGLEDLIAATGYGLGILILLLVPILWAIPTALMVGELASSIPDNGGFYVWVKRALGNFWGFQEAWQTLASSIFDMGLY